MNAWILVIVLHYQGQFDVRSIPGFAYRPSCQQAGLQIEMRDKGAAIFGVSMTCVRTGRGG